MVWKCLVAVTGFIFEGPMLNERVILSSCAFYSFHPFSGWYFRSDRFFFLLFFITVSSIIAAVVAKVQGNADTNNNRRTKEHGKKVHNVKENQESFSRKSKIKSWTCILRANRSSNGMHITKSRCFIEIRAERTKREGWVSFLHESKRQSKNWNEHNICSSYSQQ